MRLTKEDAAVRETTESLVRGRLCAGSLKRARWIASSRAGWLAKEDEG
jgi:hypothetical protein